MKKQILKCLFLCCLAVLIASCNSRINKDNFDRIKTGMSLQDVVNILGNPSSSASISFGPSTVASVRWENRNGTITVQFFNGVVKIKQFIEGVSTPRKS